MNNEQASSRLRVALQKSGKLSEGSLDLLNKCNFKLNSLKNHLLLQSTECNSEFLMVRDDDIPELINCQIADIGIIGENLLTEYSLNNSSHNLEVIAKLNFAFCRLSIAASLDGNIKSLKDLDGKTIATSYPATLHNFLKENKINAKVIVMHGSVELSTRIGIADAICDLVSTGATIMENGLTEIYTILKSEALLVANKHMTKYTRSLVDNLNFRFQSVINAKNRKYIMLHIAKDRVTQLKELLPGSESPTVLQLDGNNDKVAVHVVSREDQLWETIGKLKQIGATSILVVAIEKMMN